LKVEEMIPKLAFAGFWRRGGAFCIDLLILGLLQLPLIWTLVLLLGLPIADPEHFEESLGGPVIALLMLSQTALFWLYFAIQESRMGATLGKRALNVRVTSRQGMRLSFARASLRWLTKTVLAWPLGLTWWVQLFTTNRQALHDLIAGSLVLHVDLDDWSALPIQGLVLYKGQRSRREDEAERGMAIKSGPAVAPDGEVAFAPRKPREPTTIRLRAQTPDCSLDLLSFGLSELGPVTGGPGGIVIGRMPDPGGRFIDDPEVSSRHLRLEWWNGRLVATDLGSLNGSMINGEEMLADLRYPLEHGDSLSLGPVKFTVEING